jgi:Mg-chelatase subunit ChlD
MSQTQDFYRQKMLSVLQGVEGIQLSAIPLYNKVPRGLKFEMPVLFRIAVGDHKDLIKRTPIHVCLVLDRSGSMAGAPIEHCKKSIKHALSLMEPTDRVSFVAYDDSVETVFQNRQPDDELLPKLIDTINQRGWTNISGGLVQAAKILNETDSTTLMDKIIFLFSDGNANRGIVDLDQLGTLMAQWVDHDGIRFSAFGIGTDYNEKWMRSIARGGEGSYFFIDNVENIPHLVEKGLSGFTKIIGETANFRLNGVNGHNLVSLQGDKSFECLQKGKTFAHIRNLGLYQYISIVEMNPPAQDLEGQKNRVLEYTFKFKPKNTNGDQVLTGFAEVCFCDANDFDMTKKNPAVVCYLTIGECAEINHKVDEAIKARNTAEAIKLKREIIKKYKSVLDFDDCGVIGALLERENTTLIVLEREGLTLKASKKQEYTTSYGYNTTTTQVKATWEINKVVQNEEEGDMGFALFD